MPSTFPSKNSSSLPKLVPSSSTSIDTSQSPSNKPSRLPHIFNSVDASIATSSIPLYVPSVNPSRAPSEQHVGYLQEEKGTTLEQVKSLENIIASGEVQLHQAAQLRELYIIKLKCDICMLETNVNNFSEGKKFSHRL